MNAIQILVAEHERILSMIEVSKVIVNNSNADNLPLDDVEKIVDFIRNFADKYHHMKEEDELFIEMGKNGMPVNAGPIGVMLHEHNEGRAYVKQVTEAIDKLKAGDKSAYPVIKENLMNYGELLTNHIYKENNILYPMAEKLLPKDIMDAMVVSFEKKNASTVNNEYSEKYLRMAEELAAKYL